MTDRSTSRLRVKIFSILFISIGLLTVVSGSRTTYASQSGTIRGTVFLDQNGDGTCSSRPVYGINVRFELEDYREILFSGADGTFGMPAATQGKWRITAIPDQSKWRVTSANPRAVTVSFANGLVQTGVDFCVEWIGNGPAQVSAPVQQPTTLIGRAISTVQQIITNVQAPDRRIPSSQERMTIAEMSAVSTSLLENPPPSRPPATLEPIEEDEIEAIAQTPVETEDWLGYLNNFRAMAGLPLLVEDPALSEGAQLHSRYMVINDVPIAHNENRNNPLYTEIGHRAGENGLIFATPMGEADFTWAINFWVSAPFHLVPLLDPELKSVGYGVFNREIGNFHMASVLDVRTNLGQDAEAVNYPILFPGDGSTTWVVRHSLYEWPNPVKSCPGYGRPTGAPIVAMLGDGSGTPRVSSYAVRVNGTEVGVCMLHENNYVDSGDAWGEQTGRKILDERDAVILIPLTPLPINATVEVELVANGEAINWSYQTARGPAAE